MVIFSHRGIGFGKKENSLATLRSAIENGFSVEVDLRFQKNKIILSHNLNEEPEDTEEFSGLLKLMGDSPEAIFALHLKENSQDLFENIQRYLKPFSNFLLFVTDFPQDNFIKNISGVLGESKLTLYMSEKKFDRHLMDRVGYLWLDESKENIYDDLGFFARSKKKTICCSPELFMNPKKTDLERFERNLSSNSQDIFGICTDICLFYKGRFNESS